MRALIALLLCTGALSAQQVIGTSSFVNDELQVEVKTKAIGSASGFAGDLGMGFKTEQNSFTRFFRDGQNRLRFAYEIRVERGAQEGELRLSLLPVSRDKLGPDDVWATPDGRPATLAAVRDIPNLKAGEEVQLDVLSHAKTGGRLVDVITVRDESLLRAGQRALKERASQRYNFDLEDYRLLKNGQYLLGSSTAGSGGGIAGQVILLYQPHEGGIFLSLTEPKELQGFRKAGQIDGKRLTFHWNGDLYELQSQSQITPAGKSDVWVLVDQSYRPKAVREGRQQDHAFFSAASDLQAWQE